MNGHKKSLPIAIISSALAALLVPGTALAATEGAVATTFRGNSIPPLVVELQTVTDLAPQLAANSQIHS